MPPSGTHPHSTLPYLPLLLSETPPGLELVLAQEGIPFEQLDSGDPVAARQGRFVVYDSRSARLDRLRPILTEQHILIDIDVARTDLGSDPFEPLVDSTAGIGAWNLGRVSLRERVARHDKGEIRRQLLGWLRDAVAKAGGLWIRLAPYPHPYRGAFGFRADLDEHHPEDYFRFARAREPIDDCTTHFVSTSAYGAYPAVLRDLRSLDTQSHGHHHAAYRDEHANRANLARAHRILEAAGLHPVGYAAPHGRWNPGLDRAIADAGYLYSSDFQLAYDDWPSFPWRDGEFSPVLQVPIHPVCEGLFTESGIENAATIADYYLSVLRRKIDAGEPAFLYGHPERRLARFPEVLASLAHEARRHPLLWCVTMTAFARWWHWRHQRHFTVAPTIDHRIEIHFADWSSDYSIAVELVRGSHVASLPIIAPHTTLSLDGLAYERRTLRVDTPRPTLVRPPFGLRAWVKDWLDWETATPVDDIPEHTLASRCKKRLRRWRDSARLSEEATS